MWPQPKSTEHILPDSSSKPCQTAQPWSDASLILNTDYLLVTDSGNQTKGRVGSKGIKRIKKLYGKEREIGMRRRMGSAVYERSVTVWLLSLKWRPGAFGGRLGMSWTNQIGFFPVSILRTVNQLDFWPLSPEPEEQHWLEILWNPVGANDRVKNLSTGPSWNMSCPFLMSSPSVLAYWYMLGV